YLRYFFIALLIYVILRALFKKGFTEDHPITDYTPPNRGVMAVFGIFTGCISALLGIGGSPITVPFLRNAKLPMVNSAAIAATLGAPIALFGAAGYAISGWGNPNLPSWTTGFIFWPAIPGIVVGVLCTVPFGSKLSHSLSDKLIAKAYVVLLCAVTVAMAV
ncbi:MAG: sulfite exporter TauE/SafE family protein, partial [Pseudomonadota bacterium]